MDDGDYAAFVRLGNFTKEVIESSTLGPMGLMGEAAEVMQVTERRLQDHLTASRMAISAGSVGDYLKKVVIHGDQLDREKLIKELGDVFWYAQHIMNTFLIDFEEVRAGNVAKLCDRYPERYGPAEDWGVKAEPGSGAR